MMLKLADILENRTNHQLRATAAIHRLPFDTKQPTQAEAARLYGRIQVADQVKRLNACDIESLMALYAGGGRLPRGQFCAQHGEVRPYRPWREDCPRTMWRYPASPAEKLWFLGFIELVRGRSGQPDVVHLAEEIIPYLPPLPRPVIDRGLTSLPEDIARWLSGLLSEQPRVTWGRWLSLRVLRRLNQRLSHPENLESVRSELQTERLRRLHYVAEVAGLVAVQGGHLLPTTSAWHWLHLSPLEQGEWLLKACQNASPRITEIYRLSDFSLPDITSHLQTRPVRLMLTPDAIGICTGGTPPLRALVEVGAWASIDANGWWIDAAALRQAVGQGLAQAQIEYQLRALTQAPLSEQIREKIASWYQVAGELCFQTVSILTARNAQVLAELRQDRHLRQFFEKSLSPYMAQVKTHKTEELHRRLQRRGYLPSNALSSVQDEFQMADYAYFAMRVVQGLGVDLPIPIPAAVCNALALSDEQKRYLDSAAQETLARLHTHENGKVPSTMMTESDVPFEVVHEKIEKAFLNHTALIIDYFTPSLGQVTRRTIEPLTPISENDGAYYVDAWCQLVEDVRTFRLDRIIGFPAEPSPSLF